MSAAPIVPNIEVGKTALLTLSQWFYAPDGKQYRAVFGTVKAIRTAQDTLGVTPRSPSTNWYVEIGNVTVAGCQLHYAVRTDHCNTDRVQDWRNDDKGALVEFERPTAIYRADSAQAVTP